MTTIQSGAASASICVVMHEHEIAQLTDIFTREGFRHNPDDIATWITRACYLYVDHEINLGDDYTFFDRHQMDHLIRFILKLREEIPVKWKNIV